MSITYFSEEHCVMCGEIIEEGRQVCFLCEQKIFLLNEQPEDSKITGVGKRNKLFTRFKRK